MVSVYRKIMSIIGGSDYLYDGKATYKIGFSNRKVC